MSNSTKSTVPSGSCAVCGQTLPGNAPEGLCPACLLGRGLELATRSSAKPGDFVPPSPDELSVLFPEYEIVSLVGRGGMGAVYKGIQRELDRPVAIKFLPPETGQDTEFMERFQREAVTLARLDHPGIVRLFEYGQRGDFTYFVMEFVDGVDLSQRMASGPMSLDEAVDVVGQICDALQHSHERGVVHRDIKPANILVACDGRVKVADFGLARLVQPALGDLGLTRTHARLGTPRYMAPEQLSGAKTTDHRVDIYALGVVLYELLTGRLPVGRFDPPSEKVSALTPRIDEVILRALAAEPDRRFGSMLEMKEQFRQAVTNPGPTQLERRRRIAVTAFIASLVAAAAGICAALIWSSTGVKNREASIAQRPAPLTLPIRRVAVFGLPCPLAGEPLTAVAFGGAREEFGLALQPDGQVRGWGENRFGQIDVPPGLHGVVAVAAGQGAKSAHALALRVNGTVVGWGDNTFRQATPPEGLTNVVSIAAGEFHSLALTGDGRVVAWGNRSSPAVAVPGDLGTVKAIAAGSDFSLALLATGRVVAWGLDDAGQCQVPPAASAIVEIAAGQRHAVGRLEDGRVLAWGDNTAKQCNVPSDLPLVAAVFAGSDGTAATDKLGKLHLWGRIPAGIRDFSGRVEGVAIGFSTWAVLARLNGSLVPGK